jgi:hypothetical protein
VALERTGIRHPQEMPLGKWMGKSSEYMHASIASGLAQQSSVAPGAVRVLETERKAHKIDGCYPGVRTSWFKFYRPKPRQQVMSKLHVYTQQTSCDHSCATGCKASGMLKAGEFTFEETSYIMSRSAGKGTRSAWAASRARLGFSQATSSCSLSITGIRL